MVEELRRWFLPFADPEVASWSASARWLQRLTFLWLAVGLVVLFSASLPMSLADHGDGLYYIKRQVAWAVLGVLGYSAVLRMPLKWWWRIAGPGLLVCAVLMGLTLSHGTEVNEASRWLALGPLLLQPSELVKPFLILQSSRLFANWFYCPGPARLCWLGVFALLVGMTLLQPNLSMAGLMGMTLWVLALVAGLPWFYLGTTAVAGAALAGVSLMLRDYQRQRVVSFLNPWADPLGHGYQLVQSLLAVGSGGLWGMGLGMSQQKLFFLPIQHTDFIFAVFAEEFGLVGSLLLLMFLLVYGGWGLRVALLAETQPALRLVALGATVLLVGQSLLNIGVATGVLPTTGLPLPFFSYGGNSLLASFLLAGLLVRVAREVDRGAVMPWPQR
ncbi:MAG: FtsW/RodA/SpoVE family cell cycle protein [Gloeomargarita sp. SKYBB_i_bin120]|nr:putative lipid II flippase FtsW [Gloeomargarita sp. SKYG98]MCS7292187.1 putative lipid II flippase FtsW [Gloeomargarita sp. SKYB120]MDW8177748.1 FtsW/RodA/SpoVE family cell cycle protein [Gloeomargarita sp. SKYBB_i_bin120]